MDPWVGLAGGTAGCLFSLWKLWGVYIKGNNNAKDLIAIFIIFGIYIFYDFAAYSVLREHYMSVVIPSVLLLISFVIAYCIFDKRGVINKTDSKLKWTGALTILFFFISLTTLSASIYSVFSPAQSQAPKASQGTASPG